MFDWGEIYLLTNKNNNKRYVGQALAYLADGRKNGAAKRFEIHVKRAENNCQTGCRVLEAAIRKYGAAAFRVEVLLQCNREELNFYEDKFVEAYNTRVPNGYNLLSGGGNGRVHSEETRAKMSATRTGKTHSTETKKRMSDTSKGKPKTKKHRANIGKSSKYRNMKPATKAFVERFCAENDLDHLPQGIYTQSQKDVITGFYARHNRNRSSFTTKDLGTMQNKYELAKKWLREQRKMEEQE